MTIKQVTAWEDSKGVLFRSQTEAEASEQEKQDQKVVNDVATILQAVSRELGKPKNTLPQTIDEASRIAVAAYPALKQYFEGT